MKVRLLLSTQRSGSHYLKSVIDRRFTSATCTGEILREPLPALMEKYPALSAYPGVPHFWPWYEREAATGAVSVAPDQRLPCFHTYVEKLQALVAPRDLVLDVKYNSVRSLSGYWDSDYGSHSFVSYLIEKDIPVLHLIRRNVLKTIVSNLIAQRTGIWHRADERASGEALAQIRLNPKQVLFDIRYALRLTEDYQTRLRNHPRCEEMHYEDLCLEEQSSVAGPQLRALARFLDQPTVDTSPMVHAFTRTTPENLAEVVENWDEIVQVLALTKFSWMAESCLEAAA